jgi:multicomponent Na+:H+ antiporter subunit E
MTAPDKPTRTPEAIEPAPAGPRRISAAAMFSANLMVALVWVAMTGGFNIAGLLVGFVIGYVVLFLLQRVTGRSSYFFKSVRLVNFVLFYAWEVVRSNIEVAYDVVTPGDRARPAVVAVPLDAKTDAEITLLANVLTMTPGSLSVDVSDDRKVIYVHAMFVDDPDEFRRTIKRDFERRVLELLR